MHSPVDDDDDNVSDATDIHNAGETSGSASLIRGALGADNIGWWDCGGGVSVRLRTMTMRRSMTMRSKDVNRITEPIKSPLRSAGV